MAESPSCGPHCARLSGPELHAPAGGAGLQALCGMVPTTITAISSPEALVPTGPADERRVTASSECLQTFHTGFQNIFSGSKVKYFETPHPHLKESVCQAVALPALDLVPASFFKSLNLRAGTYPCLLVTDCSSAKGGFLCTL